ncbi:MAG: hypothetical protein ACJASL_004441 [Paraglaciecola sp.]|jgi:hypothetical protein
MFIREYWWQTATVLILVTVCIVSVIYWNEARKKVIYLCNNINKGVPQNSVLRQFETVNLSGFETEKIATGSVKILDSQLNFGYYKCIIKIDVSGRVEQAHIDLGKQMTQG